MSKLIDSQEVVFSNKFENFNSAEYRVLKEVFEKIPMMDTYIANIIEEYIYSYVRYYYPDGKLKCEYRTKYGEKDGECKVWYDNGQLWEQTTYIDDKINGEYKSWFYNGQITKQTTYVDGEKHGVHKEWWDNGKLWRQTTYVDDKVNGEYKRWYYEGNLWKQITYVDGKRQGNYKTWDNEGNLMEWINPIEV
jgi:hypothetical protein